MKYEVIDSSVDDGEPLRHLISTIKAETEKEAVAFISQGEK